MLPMMKEAISLFNLTRDGFSTFSAKIPALLATGNRRLWRYFVDRQKTCVTTLWP
jgi:hypothetical protein